MQIARSGLQRLCEFARIWGLTLSMRLPLRHAWGKIDINTINLAGKG
ncbi:hypothetical protein IMCC12053_683 [Celeribacter marinus]|uniref:Uncharacterized protein n=1 Tax=Celeribacter marinus TaxID=1397108 RepID=A0A0P0A9V1_9RHOB|nr:hypothetical protein IMCC12053_683 [Celeribacter marinus]